ncbi:MAG: hypothetical protein OXE17_16030 [Chloroflexi bacterium]|nr:hypothetical protein [Chloroflexota bacterium]
MTLINTPEEFLRALRENPEWREAVRAQILGDELLNLPAALQALTETVNRFVARQEQFNEKQEQFNERQERFNLGQEQFNERQDQFNDDQRQFGRTVLTRLDRMEGDSSRLKGDYSLRRVNESAEFITLDLGLQYERNMTRGEMANIAVVAASGQALSSDLKSFRNADLVIVARENGQTQYLAVEVSYTADQRDTRRAIRNARILSEQTGHVSRPVIASVRNTREVQEEVDAGQVYWHQLPDRDSQDQE